MNTLSGYSKSTLTDQYLLTAAGGHLAVDDLLTDKLLDYVTLDTNQTITGKKTFEGSDADLLTIKRTNNSNPAWIRFYKDNTLLGYIGVNDSKNPVFLKDGEASRNIIHSGNYSTYLPYLNSSSAHATNTSVIYAPATAGTKGQILTSNGSGAPSWMDPSTIAVGKTKVLDNLYTNSTRPTSLNIQFGDGGLRTFKATSATTEGKCTGGGHIIHLAWDATNGWDNQLAITCANYGKNFGIQFRGQNEGTWSDWHPVLTDLNYHEYLGYIGTTTVQASGALQALTGISSIFVNTGDATLKVYNGGTSESNDGTICLQTSIDGTDGQSHTYPTQWHKRCNLALQPRGGSVYIGTVPEQGTNTYKLWVQGSSMHTGTIHSDLNTRTHLNGNKGTAIINSTAAAGYNMLAKMNSTNGVFTIGAYDNEFNLYYTTNTTIAAETNSTTYRAQLLNESGNTVFPGRLYVGSQLNVNNNYFNYGLAVLDSWTAAVTGTIVITLPAGFTNSMNTYEIDIYEYNGYDSTLDNTQYSKLIISGYNWDGEDGKWINYGYVQLGSYAKGVRLGYNGSKCCILLGNTSSTWKYPKIRLSRVLTAHESTSNFNTGYSISTITSESGYSRIVSAYRLKQRFERVVATEFTGSLANTLTFAAGTFTANTYNNSAAVTVNIPTKTSHLTNDSGFLTAHQSLANYVTLNSAQTISAKKTFSVQQEFTVAQGTSPFTVTSNTLVSNLNADLLDGWHRYNIQSMPYSNFALIYDSTPLLMSDIKHGNTSIVNAPNNSTPFGKAWYCTNNVEWYPSSTMYFTPGETICIESWIMRPSGATGTSGTYYLGIQFRDKQGKPVSSNNGCIYFSQSTGWTCPSDGVWYRRYNEYTIPSSHTAYNGSDGGGYYSGVLRILLNYSSGTVPTYFGGVRIYRKNIPINADTVDGFHVTGGDNKPWGTVPAITTSGWMDIGKQLEFHYDNTTGSDYSTLLKCTGNHGNVIDLPSDSGTLALTSQIPTNTWRGITDSYTGTDSTISLSQKGANDLLKTVVTYTKGTSYVGASFNNSELSIMAADHYIEYWDSAGGWFNSRWGQVQTISGFKKVDYDDTYVLLAGGGHKALSDLSATHSHSYLPLNTSTVNTLTSSQMGVLNCNSTDTVGTGIRLYNNGNNKGGLWWGSSYGIYLYNATTQDYLGLEDNGTLYFYDKSANNNQGVKYTLLHTGNADERYLKTTGGIIANANTGLYINRTTAGTNAHMTFLVNGTSVGDIGVSYDKKPVFYDYDASTWVRLVTQSFNGNITATAFYSSSDINLKTNIHDLTSSDNIPQLKEFDWKEDGSHSYGLIAQELEQMGYSELVTEVEDHKTVNYSAALSLIVGKLQVKIKELEKEIENLKNKN